MNVTVCDFDGRPVGDRYLSLQYVQEHHAGTARQRATYVTFHDGMCAAGWLGKLGIGTPKEAT